MSKEVTIDTSGIYYKELNEQINEIIKENPDLEVLTLDNVLGQRFIGNAISKKNLTIIINGVPGGDLAMFMKGPRIEVYGNADHAPGNTLDEGKVIIHGSSGDATGHSMRGGTVYVQGSVGYRSGIHMKEYKGKTPVLIIGETAGDFLGEYMAGGIIINLNMKSEDTEFVKNSMLGTGIHGGVIYIRGKVDKNQLGVAADIKEFNSEDLEKITYYVEDYCKEFNYSNEIKNNLLNSTYTKIAPISSRPFKKLYTPDIR
ncbi:hypothetical protein [Methanococcus voltae]|jgi:glutamate synthase domain-containing protein 3|uniref:Glutamate synthase alpha subunit domain protein n=1 Tax=Methanococcus voltae (strain ATCC BAA-1334 / A3) TaxID=456320 RepID=D7DQF9_METV3|nr:hypothetical protein [Methanococcus voltae]MCS3901680.1 glutamate synthase domain-containing protein 3 [Methanococcus voltae]